MSKTTIGFNIHPTKTLRYLIKEGKTLVFKSRVNFDTGIGLDTYPMNTGEILEKVCKMYIDGFTEGNKNIKVISNNVTYNTDAVTKGALYCISYRDEGFYVGLRTTEDYEPKEGDWWCISCNTQNQPYKPYPGVPIILNNVCPNDTFVIVYDKTSHIIFAGTNTNVNSGYYITIQAYVNGSYTACTANKTNATDLMWPVRSITIGNKITFRTGKNVDNIQTDFGIDVLTAIGPTCFLMKTINFSDILSYQNTGKMGGIILGEELEVRNNNLTTSKSIPYDNNTQVAIFMYDANGNLMNYTGIYYNQCGPKASIYKESTDTKNSIYNIYSVQHYNYMYIYKYDYISYFENTIPRKLNFEHNIQGVEIKYTIRAFKVLQNNMTTPSLLSNNLNSNSNDETDG